MMFTLQLSSLSAMLSTAVLLAAENSTLPPTLSSCLMTWIMIVMT